VGAYYFQTRSDLPTPYIPGLTGGRWEEWRRDWVIATTEANERLALPTEGPATDRASWRAKPSLQPEFDSVLSKIRSLAESGLTSLHVLGDFLKRRIAPLKQRPRPTWSFTGPNDCSRTHRGEGSDLTQEALEVLVQAVTWDTFIPENLILPQGVVPLCEDSRLRSAVLATLPTLDEGGLAARQTGGDPNRGIRIPGASGGLAVSSIAESGPTVKGKQAVAGSAATSGTSQARSSSGASSGDAGRCRLQRGDVGQGSSQAPGHRETSGVDAPPQSPPSDASPWQQQQQKQSSGLRGRWRPIALGLVLFWPHPLFSVLRFVLKAPSLSCQGSTPKQFFHRRWSVCRDPGVSGLGDDGGCGDGYGERRWAKTAGGRGRSDWK